MIYVENDFYSNFQGAIKSNDDQSLKVMVIDQISTLIAKHRGELLELFQKAGVRTSVNPSNEEIVNLIIENIKVNVKLRAGLSFLIAKNNDLLATAVKNTRKGDKKEKEKQEKINYEESADTVTYIANSINILMEDLKGESLSSFKEKLQQQTNNKAPNFSSQAYSKVEGQQTPTKKKSNLWKWALVIAVVGGVYYAYKKGMFNKTSETGGIIEN
jgi:hypothetical protein